MNKIYPLFLTFLLVISGLALTVQAQETTSQAENSIKFIVDAGEVNLESSGVTLLADYGSFQLLLMTGDQMNRWHQQDLASKFVPVDDTMTINGHALPTKDKTLAASLHNSRANITGKSLQLIQFVGPIQESWLKELEAVGVEPIHYIANNGYLVWADDNGRSELNKMMMQSSFLQWSMPFYSELKMSPDLLSVGVGGGETAVLPIAIQMIQHDGPQETEAIIESLLVTQESDWQPVLKFQTIHGTIRQQDILKIAELPDVYWLGAQQSFALHDEVQGQIVAGNVITTSAYSAVPTGPGYLTWLDSYGFSQDPADYPIVDITDDGLGTGSASDAAGDQTLREFGLLANPSRITTISNCTGQGDGGGIGGHGHLNLSIAGGYDTRADFPYQDASDYQLGLGINPYGRFSGTRVFYFQTAVFPYGFTEWDISGCDGTYAGLIKQNQDNGARITNNSWGSTSTTYGESAQAYDIGVRDSDGTETGNQEMIYLFSAGNAGNFNSIGNPATAKNVITVGASENYRPTDFDGCNKGALHADDVMDIADFSSLGPAVGNRTKPELVAPGSHVQGAASPNPLFNGNTVCGSEDNDFVLPSDDVYYPIGQSIFTWSSGSSHSAPGVAGIASLYYYWFEHTHQQPTPSPAMMKAYLLAHTMYLTGARANDTLPSNTQGYGLPDMDLGLDDTPRVFSDQQTQFTQSGEQWTREIIVADPTKPVRLVMAYTDAAGALGTNPQVNDLNLRIDSSTETYVGNHFLRQWSVTGGAPDANNNYEAIFLPPGSVDAFDLTVTAFNIAGDGVPGNGDDTDQDFALICYNCIELLHVEPASQAACLLNDDSVAYVVEGGGTGESMTFSADSLPPNTTAVFNPNPVTLPMSSTLTISNLSASTGGTYAIQIMGTANTFTRTVQTELNLYASEPLSLTLSSPANGAVGRPFSVLLRWEALATSEEYALEIAMDSDFTQIVDSASGLSATQYQTTVLLPDTTYYWRVRGSNLCGNGEFSDVFHFTTQNALYLPIIIKE